MRSRITTVLILLASLINIAPIPGVAGQRMLETLYGVSISSPELVLLMQHRAILFGIVGGLLLVSAFRHTLRPVAGAVGMASMTSFLLLFPLETLPGSPLAKIFWGDVGGVLALASALVLDRKGRV